MEDNEEYLLVTTGHKEGLAPRSKENEDCLECALRFFGRSFVARASSMRGLSEGRIVERTTP